MKARSCFFIVSAAFLSAVCAFVGGQTGLTGGAGKKKAKKETGGLVVGIVLANPKNSSLPIYVPGFEVQLKDAKGRIVESEMTDFNGSYSFPHQPPGEYQLCWNVPGWVPESFPEKIVIASKAVYVPLTATPQLNPKTGVLWGQVKLADGGPPFFFSEYFGVTETAVVQIADSMGKQIGKPVPVSSSGEFIAVGIPISEISIHAKMGKARSLPIDVHGASLSKGAVRVSPLIVDETRPQITSVTAWSAGKPVTVAKPGDEVECRVSATSVEGHKLTYRWKTSTPSIKLQEGGRAVWKLSATAGIDTAYVLVSDSRGGYAQAKLAVAVRGDGKMHEAKSGPLPQCTVFPLHQPFLSRKRGVPLPNGPSEQDLIDAANAYYAAIDPKSKRTTLGDWWQQNGFDRNTGVAPGEAHAAYLNNNDLGFGREMHIVQNGAAVAGYVTNYSTDANKNPNQDSLNADLANSADPNTAIATVCMEYSPVDGQDPSVSFVKFYVYNGKLPGSTRQLAADLDTNGPKFVPNLCLNCHGGNYRPRDPKNPTPLEINVGASFREFDLDTFLYPRPGTSANDPSRRIPNASEQAAFKRLNEFVVVGQASEQGIKELVAGWYAGGPTQDNNFTPVGWQGAGTPQAPSELYHAVVKKSCRTCHVAFGSSGPRPHDWTTFDQFKLFNGTPSTIAAVVCGPRKDMPHAQVTFCNFWNSNQVDALRNFATGGWNTLGSCPP